ncbi:hypothetical protein [Oscillospiraceae bacterium]|nr:hypothetical protein [Oscillospiraceae bacterium]
MKFLNTCKNLAFYRGMQRKIQLCKEIIKKFEFLKISSCIFEKVSL